MFMPEPLPPVEWMHSKRCYASALISAVENFRDSELLTDFEFAGAVQESSLRDEAVSYLTTGLQTCICERTCQSNLPPWLCKPGWLCKRCEKKQVQL